MGGMTQVDGITATDDIDGSTITNSTITGSPISGSTGSFTTVSAATFVCTGNITSDGTMIPSFAIISAAGSAQATAALCSAQNCRLMGVTDDQATGFRLMANKIGLEQQLYMNTAASANLYPPVGGTINGGSANAPFALAANTMYTVLHYAASAMGVK